MIPELKMTPIEILGGIIFVKNDEDSDNLIETYNAEYNGESYRLKIDRTTIAPYYELYRDWYEGKRHLTSNIFNSSVLAKVSAWIGENLR